MVLGFESLAGSNLEVGSDSEEHQVLSHFLNRFETQRPITFLGIELRVGWLKL